MKLQDVRPADCYARAQRLLAEVIVIRTELGRAEDARPLPELTDAQPRECYFEALATWSKADRLAAELGARTSRFAQGIPGLRELRPGHVLQVVDAILGQVEDIKDRLQISETMREPPVEPTSQPGDVLRTLIRVNRELSRSLERPFTPADCYRTVAKASAYATRMGAVVELAPFERARKPRDCYERLLACHAAAAKLIAKRGEAALTTRSLPMEVLPGDVYDLACLVVGELAFLHALSPKAAPLHAFEPSSAGHRLPAQVDQLARTLEAQLAMIE